MHKAATHTLKQIECKKMKRKRAEFERVCVASRCQNDEFCGIVCARVVVGGREKSVEMLDVRAQALKKIELAESSCFS